VRDNIKDIPGTTEQRMKHKKILLLIFFILSLCTYRSGAQVADTSLLQFSGVVVTADSLRPIPFVSIAVQGTYRGTLTDLSGFYSIVARKKEVLEFSSVGFKTIYYKIPDTLIKDRYTLIQVMRPDTLYLNETFIYPWATYEQFKEAFVNTVIPDDEMERARKNVEEIEKRVITEYVPMDGSMNYRNYVDQYRYKLYYAGQMPPNNLLNPIAWAQFFKAWKEGKFKTKRRN
jgi:hypothetical protein